MHCLLDLLREMQSRQATARLRSTDRHRQRNQPFQQTRSQFQRMMRVLTTPLYVMDSLLAYASSSGSSGTAGTRATSSNAGSDTNSADSPAAQHLDERPGASGHGAEGELDGPPAKRARYDDGAQCVGRLALHGMACCLPTQSPQPPTTQALLYCCTL